MLPGLDIGQRPVVVGDVDDELGPPPGEVVDIVDLLKRSLAEAKRKQA